MKIYYEPVQTNQNLSECTQVFFAEKNQQNSPWTTYYHSTTTVSIQFGFKPVSSKSPQLLHHKTRQKFSSSTLPWIADL